MSQFYFGASAFLSYEPDTKDSGYGCRLMATIVAVFHVDARLLLPAGYRVFNEEVTGGWGYGLRYIKADSVEGSEWSESVYLLAISILGSPIEGDEIDNWRVKTSTIPIPNHEVRDNTKSKDDLIQAALANAQSAIVNLHAGVEFHIDRGLELKRAVDTVNEKMILPIFTKVV